jgi:hypothetical protein
MIRIAAAVVVTLLWAQSQSATDHLPPPIAPEKFDRLHRMLVPTAEELAEFWDLPWEIDIHTAREKAAAQDKPILGYLGANGSSLGAT